MEEQQNEDKRGFLDIVTLFEGEVSRLLGAVSTGRILHGTHNIRDSGQPFEEAFRSFLAPKLPSLFEVIHGYFYDAQSKCTHQIDGAIVLGRERYSLLTAADGACYVPFSSAVVIFELKNSASGISNHLDQLVTRKKELDDMRKDMFRRHPNGASYLSDITTALVVGDSSNLNIEALQAWYLSNLERPNYLLLLDRGVLIANRAWAEEFFEYDEPNPIGFYDYRNGKNPYVFKSKDTDRVRGRALLWFYFALIAHTNLSNGNRSHILSFTNDAVTMHALYSLCSLADLNKHEEDVSIAKDEY